MEPIHSQERQEKGQAMWWVGLRERIAQLNGWSVVRYVFLAVAGVLLFKEGAAYALRERRYYAVGGGGALCDGANN